MVSRLGLRAGAPVIQEAYTNQEEGLVSHNIRALDHMFVTSLGWSGFELGKSQGPRLISASWYDMAWLTLSSIVELHVLRDAFAQLLSEANVYTRRVQG